MDDLLRGFGASTFSEFERPQGFNLVAGAALGRLKGLWDDIDERARVLENSIASGLESAEGVEHLRRALTEFELAAAGTWKYSGHVSEDEFSQGLRDFALQSWLETRRHVDSGQLVWAAGNAVEEFVHRASDYLSEKEVADDLRAQDLLIAAARAFVPFGDPESADIALNWLGVELRTRMVRDLVYFAHELSLAGREDLAASLHEPGEATPRFGSIPENFGDIVQAGLDLNLSMARRAKQVWDGLEQIMLTQSVGISRAVAASPELVWRAIIGEGDSRNLPQMTGDGEVELGGVNEGAEVVRHGPIRLSGNVVEARPNSLLVWDWAPAKSHAYSSVELRLERVVAGTRVVIDESGCPSERFFDTSILDVGVSDPRRRPWGSEYGRPDDRKVFWQAWLSNLAQRAEAST